MRSSPLSLPRALWVFLRSRSLRQAAGASLRARLSGSLPRAGKRALELLSWVLIGTSLGVAVSAAVFFVIFGVGKAGRVAELWASDSAPRVFHALPAASFGPQSVSALSSLTLSNPAAAALENRAKGARRDKASLIGISDQERSSLLSAIDERLREEARRREELALTLRASDFLQSALLLAQLLEEGKTPEQAAAALRAKASRAALPPRSKPALSEAEQELGRLRALLASSPPRRAEELSLSQRFSFSFDSLLFASHPLAYAEEQSQGGRRVSLAFIGLGMLIGLLLLGWGAARGLFWARAWAKESAPELEREAERQSLEGAALKAPKAGSRRL